MSALLLLALLAAPFAPQADGSVDELVRLRDGRLLVGIIEEHDLDGFQLVQARSGGKLRLAWSDLFPGESERLMQSFGIATEISAPTTTAHRLLLRNGREIVGRILSQDVRGIQIRTLESTLQISPQMIAAPPEEIVVEASVVLTPEQFYQERMSGVPVDDGYAQFLFAQELEQMFALQRARERLDAAEVLAKQANDQPLLTRITGAMTKLDVLILNQAEAEALEQIRRAMYRERFEEAEAGIASFMTTFPQPRLKSDFLNVRDKFKTARAQAITRYLARNWFNRAMDEVKRHSLDRDAGVDSLLAWVESELPVTIRQRLGAELEQMDDELDPSALDSLWASRLAPGLVRHRASYGEGTWILGEERARAGMEKTTAEEKDDGKTAEQREMEERVQRYLKNLETQKRAASGAAAEGEATPDDWWRQASVTERSQFLLAYYAEFSGDFETTTLEFKPCPICGGTGVIETVEISSQGSQNRRLRCTICHGVAVKRALNFR